ncbi:nucleoside deaminase [Ochrobactrum sp. CM-21-5]|nr:nucleoside deaminase [Ochrobactrum sp. CM-21-5]MBC2887062.1 nucleoside deaminase [Ochrobactrum sp. CM-21-5]
MKKMAPAPSPILVAPMAVALDEARAAGTRGEVPIGAVVLHQGKIIARAGNRTREMNDVTAHAEVLVIRDAGRILQTERLIDCDLYVTLEPCAMCAAAISFARFRRLYYGASDPKGGGVEHGPRFFSQPTCHHVPEVYAGFSEGDSQSILRSFFREKR